MTEEDIYETDNELSLVAMGNHIKALVELNNMSAKGNPISAGQNQSSHAYEKIVL